MAMKLKVVGDRGELRDYFDLMTIEQRTNRTVDEGLALFLERFQPEFPDQALNHIVLGLGYFRRCGPRRRASRFPPADRGLLDPQAAGDRRRPRPMTTDGPWFTSPQRQ